MRDVIEALAATEAQLDDILRSLDGEGWRHPSACPGWSVTDVVLHLAQTEEGVAATLRGEEAPLPVVSAATVDEIMEGWVRAERGAAPTEVHERWDRARRTALDELQTADPNRPVAWAAAPLKPRTLATTRISEHWIHTLDIAEPLGIEVPDTDDLHHVAWLAFRTLPFAFAREGRGEPPAVRLELEAPDGSEWTFGDEDAECKVSGPAGRFLRIAARRLASADAPDVVAEGPRGQEVLELVRTYA